MKRETAEKYIELVKTEGVILKILEKELSDRKKRLKNNLDYLRMAKKRGYVKKISQYEYEYIGE